MRVTLSEKLLAADGKPAGFDYVRIGLALAVVAIHIPQIVYGMGVAYAFWWPWLRPVSAIIVPSFFALSGFLVAGSLLRCPTLVRFFGLRIMRIGPALAVEVFLSAFVLGPVFTYLALGQYFSDPLFFRYFWNLVGHVQFVLPGIFANNPFPDQVNAQLWTVPPELRCYLLTGILSILLVFRNRSVLLAITIAFNLAIFFWHLFDEPVANINAPAITLVACFLVGVVLFVWRDRVIFDARLFWVSLVASVILLWIPRADYLIAFPVAYATVYLGAFNPYRSKTLFSGDYSYGMYLYGFPIQQAVAAILGGFGGWLLNLAVSLPLIVGIAYFSWWCVEKPVLKLRPLLAKLENAVIALIPFNLKPQKVVP